MSDKISSVIKGRLEDNGVRYWANDNISAFITDAEKELLIDEATAKYEEFLDALVIDRHRDPNSMETGRRVAKMYIKELMSGRYEPMPKVTAFPNEDREKYEGMIVVPAEIKSSCSHHHAPVSGTAYIGIVPKELVIGLSKYIRIAQWCARRGTLQEGLVVDIANEIQKATGSEDLAVYIQGTHGCCENRGVMAHNSLTQTTVLRGSFFHNASVKQEFFDNIKLHKMHG